MKPFEQGIIDYIRQDPMFRGNLSGILDCIEGRWPEEGTPEHRQFVDGFEFAKQMANSETNYDYVKMVMEKGSFL